MYDSPGEYDFKLYAGATFSRLTRAKDSAGTQYNLAGFTARMQVRCQDDPRRRCWNESQDAVFDLTTENGGLVLGGSDGIGAVRVNISAEDSTPASDTGKPRAGKYVYDIELINGDVVHRYLQGWFEISGEVSRG